MMGDGPLLAMRSSTMFDADKDGKITTDEIDAHRKGRMMHGDDANEDGKLSAEELAAQEVKMMPADGRGPRASVIEMLDVDGDGLLSVEEMAARPMPVMMFDRMDADGDGAYRQEAEADARAGRHERIAAASPAMDRAKGTARARASILDGRRQL